MGHAPYFPTNKDQDGWLFLETLLSARKSLCFSFVNRHIEDGRSLSPSFILQDFLSYLKEKFQCIIDIQEYSTRFSISPASQTKFIPEFSIPQKLILPSSFKESTMPLKILKKTVKNSLQAYCNHTLKLFSKEKMLSKNFNYLP